MENEQSTVAEKQKSFSWFKLFFVVCGAMIVSGAILLGVAFFFLFPREFKPVHLNPGEEKILQRKLNNFEGGHRIQDSPKKGTSNLAATDDLKPAPYSEVGARREIVFSEREVNSLLAKNTELAKKLAIDFSEDLASAKLILPVDPDFPVLGGKTIKASAGVELSFRSGRPLVILRGISIWGVPIPNAWLGNLKNVDLIERFGHNPGFWKGFAAGIKEIKVTDGRLLIILKE